MTRRALLFGWIAVLCIGLSAPAFGQAAKKKRIAVGDFFTKGGGENVCRGIPSNYGQTIGASLRTKLVETGAFSVLSREQMMKIMKEHELAMTGLADAENAKLTGQFLQADLILGGDFVCNGDNFELNINLVDTETAEILWAKSYEVQDASKKMSLALKDIAGILAKYAKTGKIDSSQSKTEALMMIDAKVLHTTANYISGRVAARKPRLTATVEDVNAYDDTIKVRIGGAGNQAWPGFKMLVKRGDDEVGWLYLKKKGTGTVEAGTTGEISAFEQGDRASSESFKPKIAMGFIEDVEMDNPKLIELFRDGVMKNMTEDENLDPMDDSEVDKIVEHMGNKTNKKDLEKLFKKGVDLLVTGRFLGSTGERRFDFEIINTVDGKAVLKDSCEVKIHGKGL